MFTLCPNCSAVFTVKADHLQAAGGLVRCGSCKHLYNAANYLFEDIDVAHEWIEFPRPPLVRQLVARPDAPGSAATSRVLPGSSWQQHPVGRRHVGGGVGIGLLILLLGVQWLYFNRVKLVNDADWRPTTERICAFLPCNLPFRSDLAQLELLERDVRKHPRAENALLINATLTNHASHVQPYPVFSVSFTNLSGRPVAMRYFRPAEYLGDNTVIATGMAPGSRVQAMLEIEDPGEEAASFQLDFL